MSRNVRVFRCEPDDVFRVLADGWLYPAWVVGASRMRDVDEAWPEPGSVLRHSFGVWPTLIDDTTSVTDWAPPHRMVIRARGWPIGEACVVIDVERSAEGRCVVRMHEEPVRGPARFVPRPLLDAALRRRNAETLHRLAYLAEGMRTSPGPTSTAEREERSPAGALA